MTPTAHAMVEVTDHVINWSFASLTPSVLLAYQTEERPYPHPRSAQYVRETDRTCGLQWGMGSSEAFMLLRQIR